MKMVSMGSRKLCVCVALCAVVLFGQAPGLSGFLVPSGLLLSKTSANRVADACVTRRTARASLGLQMQDSNFLTKFARTVYEKAKADVERTKRLFNGLEAIRSDMSVIDELLSYWRLEDADKTLDQLEEALITRDFGVKTAVKICDSLREAARNGEITQTKDLRVMMKKKIVDILNGGGEAILNLDGERPAVVMMVGVNGGGKTTSIGKISSMFAKSGKKVMLAAGDTFRAAADLQLEEWCTRAGAIMAPRSNAKSPAAVMFDAIDASIDQDVDVLIADTSGRLHTNTNLMKELEKVRGVFKKRLGSKPMEILLVVDATQGQNVLNQARGFNEAVGITGVVLTKLDGTSKGGVVVSIVDELKVPVKFIGVGEKIEDLMVFDAEDYVEALFPK